MKGKSRKALCSVDFRHKKRRPLTSIDVPMVPKAGLEHRYYPYDLKGLKLTTSGMIPSLIPSKLKFGCG
ncbi:TPA: hypothetical protein G9F27_003068 [Salmonella enterica]|uniref:Uncharacterized protein n=1 Tax=Salmonella enterica TaxID=28901 RepID=A0A743P0Z2_SALER|nr:hypothetical protein [Salmonella enterica]